MVYHIFHGYTFSLPYLPLPSPISCSMIKPYWISFNSPTYYALAHTQIFQYISPSAWNILPSMQPLHLYLTNFLKRFYLFIFRERGRKGEREWEKHQCVVASHTPPTGDVACNPCTCPDWEWNWWPFPLQSDTQSTEPHQPGLYLTNFYGFRTESGCHLLSKALWFPGTSVPSHASPHQSVLPFSEPLACYCQLIIYWSVSPSRG